MHLQYYETYNKCYCYLTLQYQCCLRYQKPIRHKVGVSTGVYATTIVHGIVRSISYVISIGIKQHITCTIAYIGMGVPEIHINAIKSNSWATK